LSLLPKISTSSGDSLRLHFGEKAKEDFADGRKKDRA
jgi:hypothetical protein